MGQTKSSRQSLREKFHDVNNALQGLSNLIVALRRDEAYTSELGDLMNSTFSRVKDAVEAVRAEAVDGANDVPAPRPSLPVRFPVLLIDPDPLSRRMSGARLKALGYRAIAVDGELAALKELSNTPAIRAALVDCVHPETTLRLCKSLLKASPELGIIFSCHESAPTPDAAVLGFTPVGVLRKPLKAHRVAELMARVGRNNDGHGNGLDDKGADR